MLRVIMIPFFAFFMLTDVVGNSKYIAVAIFIIASLTDTLDGFIARKYNLVSNFGKFMDPLADKLLVSTALICFVSIPDNPMPVWGVIVIISREFIISGFRLVAANEGIVLAASWWGKIKTTVQMVMSVLLIVNFDGEVTVHVDAAQTGVGTATCGPGVLPVYWLPLESYEFYFTFIPVKE